MVPGGDLANSFAVRGYPVDSHPLWFGTRKKSDAVVGDGVDDLGAPIGDPVELGEGAGEEVGLRCLHLNLRCL